MPSNEKTFTKHSINTSGLVICLYIRFLIFIRSFFICQFLYLIFYTVHFFKFFLYGPICIIQNLLVVAQYLTYAVISKYSLSSCIKKNYSTTVGTWARAAFVRYNGSHVLIIHDWGYAYSREVRMGHLFILALLV